MKERWWTQNPNKKVSVHIYIYISDLIFIKKELT